MISLCQWFDVFDQVVVVTISLGIEISLDLTELSDLCYMSIADDKSCRRHGQIKAGSTC